MKPKSTLRFCSKVPKVDTSPSVSLHYPPDLSVVQPYHNPARISPLSYHFAVVKQPAMGSVAVENPASVVAPHKKQAPSNSIPNIDSLEGIGNDDSDEYSTLKKLQRHLE